MSSYNIAPAGQLDTFH